MAMRRSAAGPSKAAMAMEMLFQKSLADLVKGLRRQVIGEQQYLAQALADVRREMKSMDLHCKIVALQKLTYLHMLQGADMTWAAFATVEAMSTPIFSNKQIGYLAACQSFNNETEVLLLLPNLLRKDLGSPVMYEAGLALNCLACIATPDLARELTPEVFTTLNSGRPYMRRKAALALLRMVRQHPDGLRMVFRRLTERLEDEDDGVVRIAVTVLCELTLRDPKSYLHLAPEFYRLLTTSSNNWLLIKLVKIFRALAPLEPRLAQKLGDPLCDIMRNTPAKSLLFECIRCVTESMSQHEAGMAYCILKLGELVDDMDPNLRYLSLRTMLTLVETHPAAISEHKGSILSCLDDKDQGIQRCALHLVLEMISPENLVPTVTVLQQHMQAGSSPFTDELVKAVLSMCSHGRYERVSDFGWYLDVLVHLACVPGSSHGREVARQLVDLPVRVATVRAAAVRTALRLLQEGPLLVGRGGHSAMDLPLGAAAWVVGEYAAHVEDSMAALEALLQPKVKLLGPSVQAMYVQAVLKVFITAVATSKVVVSSESGSRGSRDEGSAKGSVFSEEVGRHGDVVDQQEVGTSGSSGCEYRHPQKVLQDNGPAVTHADRGSLEAMAKLVGNHVQGLAESGHMEAQERVCNVLALMEVVAEREKVPSIALALRQVFSKELRPLQAGAQQRVPVPEGLHLEGALEELQRIGRPRREGGSGAANEPWSSTEGEVGDGGELLKKKKKKKKEEEEEEEEENSASAALSASALLAEHRAKHDPFYLPAARGRGGRDGGGDKAREGSLGSRLKEATSSWGSAGRSGGKLAKRREVEEGEEEEAVVERRRDDAEGFPAGENPAFVGDGEGGAERNGGGGEGEGSGGQYGAAGKQRSGRSGRVRRSDRESGSNEKSNRQRRRREGRHRKEGGGGTIGEGTRTPGGRGERENYSATFL